MSKQDVWMPLVLGDYLADTQRLTTEQHGAYLLLLMDYWRNGPPPADDAVLCQITGLKPSAFRKHKSTLLAFFKCVDGRLVNKRADAEKALAAQNHMRASAKASKAANARWHPENGDAPSNAPSNARAYAPRCPSPSPITVPSEQPGEVVRSIFDQGVSLLVATGSSESSARSFIGKLRKDMGDGPLLQALTDCKREGRTDPKSWLTGCAKRQMQGGDALLRSIERTYGKEAAK